MYTRKLHIKLVDRIEQIMQFLRTLTRSISDSEKEIHFSLNIPFGNLF